MQEENIILFPRWRSMLENQSLEALKQKNYEVALHKFNELLSFDTASQEIVMGKLICLMELGKYEEAQTFCEQILQNHDENYYQYLHIYLTILFQTAQYRLLIERLEDELSNSALPVTIRDQFQQLYNISEKMQLDIQNEKGMEYIEQLMNAIQDHDYIKQWHLISKLRTLHVQPMEQVILLLKEEEIHPVVKTAILEWLQEINADVNVKVVKFGMDQEINPSDLATVWDDPFVSQVLVTIGELEDHNPTLFQLLQELFHRYIYVMYPIIPKPSDSKLFSEALETIGGQYLNVPHHPNTVSDTITKKYIEEINLCEKLYSSIIEG